MSDVQGNPLDVIASGPTVLDPTTFSDAKSILEKYGLWDISLPACMHVQKGIEGKTPETLKTPAKSHDIFIVADNSVPVNAAIEFLGKNGVKNIARTTLSGTASKAGKSLLARLYNRDALVAGGETTVKVRGGGRGGRNQELVLGALLEKADFGFLVASIGTDGIDGASDMAGAIAKSGISKERNAIARALEENDSEGFLKRNKMCINIGPTGTNLNDICIVLRR